MPACQSVQFCNASSRYDAGCHSITNIDFSKVCIKEMLMKNLRQRPQMKWMVMDMTQLTVSFELSHVLPFVTCCQSPPCHAFVFTTVMHAWWMSHPLDAAYIGPV